MKRLAVFLDGTWNVVTDNTNVWRLKSLVSPTDDHGMAQSVYYDIGLGTRFGEKIRGGAFGYGIDDAVTNAYQWLIENFDGEDEIFIFGFSRGAFAARSLAGLISRCGLLKLGAPLSIHQLWDRYKKGNDVATIHGLHHPSSAYQFTSEDRWLLRYSSEVPVKFVGVWDTVGALGNFSDHLALFTGGNQKFLDTNLRVSEKYVFHAMAIDEHRHAFSPTLFTKYAPKDSMEAPAAERPVADTEQRWFIGAHSNVGGGLENDLLAQMPLKWLMEKVQTRGLHFRESIEIDPNAYLSKIDNSFAEFAYGLYRIMKLDKPYYREIGRGPEERPHSVVHIINETIDVSVFNRWHADPTYRPQNIVDWAATRNAKIDDLRFSVRTDNLEAVSDETPVS